MIPIPLPYKLAAGAVVVIAAAGLGYLKGYTSQAEKVAECNATINTMEQTYAALEEKHDELRRDSEKIVKDVSDRWADAYSRKPVVRVRQDCGSSSGVPGLSATATSHEGLRPGSGETWLTASQCERLAEDSMIDREWIYLAKEFINKHHEASK